MLYATQIFLLLHFQRHISQYWLVDLYGNSSTLGHPLVPIATYLRPSSGPVCVCAACTYTNLEESPKKAATLMRGCAKIKLLL